MALSDDIVSAESGGDPNAQNPNSSAAGAGQFINSTWLGLVKQYRPDLADGKSDADILAMRSDPTLSQQMVGAYADQNAKTLSANGFQASPGNLYLAHFAGPQGAVNLLNADPNASAASVMGPQAAAANPFLRNMTVGQLRSWAAGKVGNSSPSTPAAATPAGTAPIAPVPSVSPNAAPPQASAPAPAQSPSLGLLNNPGAFMDAPPQASPAMAGGQSAAPAASVPQLRPPPQLPQGTPAAAVLRQRLLASILSPQGNQQ